MIGLAFLCGCLFGAVLVVIVAYIGFRIAMKQEW